MRAWRRFQAACALATLLGSANAQVVVGQTVALLEKHDIALVAPSDDSFGRDGLEGASSPSPTTLPAASSSCWEPPAVASS